MSFLKSIENNIALPHFIALTLLIHLTVLFTYQNNTSKKIITSTENLVLSFNLSQKAPVASAQAAPVEPLIPVEKKVVKPIEKKIVSKKVIKKALPTTPQKSQAVTDSQSTATLPEISTVARSNYENLLASWLSKYKTYPTRAKRRRMTGEATIYVKINAKGKLLDYYLKTSTGHELLDNAVVKMIEKASPLPAIPSEFQKGVYEFVAPVKFELN